MIIVKVGEPNNVTMGDVWFDPTNKITKKVIGATTSGPKFQIFWSGPMHSTNTTPISQIGDIYIDPLSSIPNLWDGTSWIPAVPTGYIFPSMNPKVGDIWTESMSQISYIFWGNNWIPVNSIQPGGSSFQGMGAPNFQTTSNITNGMHNSQPTVQTTSFAIYGPGGTLLVKFDTLTGVITYGSGYTPDAAAQIFWRRIAGSSPRFLQNQIEGLVQDLKDVTSRLVVAEDQVLKFTQAGYKLPEPPQPIDPTKAWERAMGVIK